MSSLSLSPESRDEVLLRSLRKYYADPTAMRVLTDVLRNKTKVSLRTLDWLVTNYAKKKNIVFTTAENKIVNVFLEYKGCLKAFSKKSFDPFQRRDRIEIVDADDKPLQSTVGQLNFFRFAISNGIIGYALKNASAIEADMLQAIKHRAAKTTTQGPKAKRKELSKAAIKSATATDIKVTVRFT